MKKLVLTMLTMLTAATGAWAQGTVNVPTVKRTAGEVKEVSVVASRQGVIRIQLEGGANYRDLQFDLTLPEGITLAGDQGTGATAVQAAAANVKDANHVVFYADATAEGATKKTVKFAVVDNVVEKEAATTGVGDLKENADNYAQVLSNDIIFEIPIAVADTYEGSNVANLANVLTSDGEATKSIELANATFNIRAVILGDVNDDGKVSNADQVAIVMHLLDEPSTPFVFEAADLEYDATKPNNITNADAISLADMLLDESSSAKAFVENDVVSDVENEIEPD